MGSLLKAPAWMRPPCGARFAFGGKLITWSDSSASPVGSSTSSDAGPEPLNPKLFISQVVTEPDFISRAQSLDAVVQGGKFEEFCTMKTENSESGIEKDVWRFMKVSQGQLGFLGSSSDDRVLLSRLRLLKTRAYNIESF